MTQDPIDLLGLEDLQQIASGVLAEVLVRDHGLLASAIERPRMSVFGDEAYPSFEEKAAALMHSIARNHALVDGNKRLAWAATRTFFLLNRRDLRYTVDDAEALVLGVASGQLDVPEVARSLREHVVDAAGEGC